MKRSLLAILCASMLQAADVTVCASGCSTTSLQTALDSLAGCGDRILVKSTETQTGNFLLHYRGCGSNPITLTSDRAASWLPPLGTRVSPSQLGNMAHLITNSSASALQGVLDGMNRPPAGWIVRGVAIQSTGSTFDLVGFNVNGEAVNSAQIADNIKFQQCYFWMSSTVVSAVPAVQDMIRFDVTNGVIQDSFFGDGFFNGFVESHGIRMLTTAGPVTFKNNFITTSSEPIFTGGSTPSYATYLENGLTAQYNYFYRPWKWNFDPAQPFAADYVTAAQNTHRTGPYTISGVSNTGLVTITTTAPLIAASLINISGVGGCTVANANNWRISGGGGATFQLLNFPGCNSAYTSGGSADEFALTVCSKNLGELKWGTGINWQYNVGQNSWEPSSCGSQYNGFTDTLRTEWDSTATKPQIGTLTMTDTTHIVWTGAYRIGNISSGATSDFVGDLGICVSLPTTGTECHPVASFSGASLISSTPFSAAPGGARLAWISYTASAKLMNLTNSHNVFINVDQSFTTLGLSFVNGVGDAGFGKNHTISQNLFYANTSYITGYTGIALGAAEADDSWAPTGYTFDHNTFYNPLGRANGAFVYAQGTSCPSCANPSLQPKFTGSAVTNNLFGVSAAGGNGPFSGDGVNNTIDTVNQYFASSNIKNNAIPGGTNGSNPVTGGNAVSGNQYQAWSDPFGGLANSGTFTVVPSSPYYHAGTDAASLGADFTALPLITNLAVAPSSTTASLTFTVAAGINDIKATQPMVLEVSTSRNLQSDLGTYSTIASLDPTITSRRGSLHAIGCDYREQQRHLGHHWPGEQYALLWPLDGLRRHGVVQLHHRNQQPDVLTQRRTSVRRT